MLTVQALDGMFITPKIVGGSVGLKPIEVILTMMTTGTLFGSVGVLLAVPIGAVVKILVGRASALYLQSAFYRDIPLSAPTPSRAFDLWVRPSCVAPTRWHHGHSAAFTREPDARANLASRDRHTACRSARYARDANGADRDRNPDGHAVLGSEPRASHATDARPTHGRERHDRCSGRGRPKSWQLLRTAPRDGAQPTEPDRSDPSRLVDFSARADTARAQPRYRPSHPAEQSEPHRTASPTSRRCHRSCGGACRGPCGWCSAALARRHGSRTIHTPSLVGRPHDG